MKDNAENTKMVKPQSAVKIRLQRDVYIGEQIKRAGEVVEVDEATAKEFCDVGFECPPQFRGERDEKDPTAKMQKIFRAVRL